MIQAMPRSRARIVDSPRRWWRVKPQTPPEFVNVICPDCGWEGEQHTSIYGAIALAQPHFDATGHRKARSISAVEPAQQ